MKNLWFTISLVMLLVVFMTSANASDDDEYPLSSSFYNLTCPKALNIIQDTIRAAIKRETRMAASLIRLHFHDCFVQGCDASIMLDDAPNIMSEKNALPNKNSARGFEVIERAKDELEKICPGVVSCADIIAVAARDATAIVGGPTWNVNLGRRDSMTASPKLAEVELPSFNESLQGIISKFRSKNLSVRDMVALSGAHTLGQGQCRFFRDRVYSKGTDLNVTFATARKLRCPATGGDLNLAPLDSTPDSFDIAYFKNLQQKKGLLLTDQVLFNDGPTGSIVAEYIKSAATFKSDFAASMIKMGNYKPLKGKDGEIRRKCNVLNNKNR